MKARKYFAFLLVVCMLISLGSISGAASNNANIEIIISDDVPSEKINLIINTVNGNIGISPASLLCIFGHSTDITDVKQITHHHYSTSPKCREQTHRITFCTRSSCNYVTGFVLANLRIPCCP